MKKFTLIAAAFLFSLAAFAADSATTNLTVKKMTCLKCAGKVKAALLKVPGVENVEIDTKASKVAVTAKSTATSDQMIEAVKGAGFPASLAQK